MNELLAIVPARAGSRGVRRKNSRFLGNKPVALWTLDAVRDAGVAQRLVLCTDDEDLARRAALSGYDVIGRSPAVSTASATIADVAAYVAQELKWDGTVGVFQPTSPTRSSDSIKKALRAFLDTGSTSLMSVVRENHLYWHQQGDAITPLFADRVNRQYSSGSVLRETGAIQFVSSEWLLAEGTMVSTSHFLYELPPDEAIDIDTREELELARTRLNRGKVVFRITANRVVGSGHLYHCLMLADELWDQECAFLLKDCDAFAEELLTDSGYEYSIETDLGHDLRKLATKDRRLVVNDVLDTSSTDIFTERLEGYRVVCVEDLGAGPQFADWTVNGLYDQATGPTISTGSDWVPLRHEFVHLPPRAQRATPTRVTLAFGGTDPGRLTERVARLLSTLSPRIEIVAILGLGVDAVDLPPSVRVIRHTRDMAGEFLATDVLVTSAGRTVYEAASTGTPVVVLAQNAREATHTHLSMDKGVIFLGLGSLVDDDAIFRTVERLLLDARLRQELSKRLIGSIDGRGAERIGAKLKSILKGLT